MHRASNGRLFEKRQKPKIFRCKKCGLIASIYLTAGYFFPPKRTEYIKGSCKPAPVPALSQICHCLVAGGGQKPRHRALYRRALEQYKNTIKTGNYGDIRRQAKPNQVAVSRPQGKNSAQRSQPSRNVQIVEPQLPGRSGKSDVHRHKREGQDIIDVQPG